MNTTLSEEYTYDSSFMAGMSLRQSGHHEAQKWSTT